MKRRIFLMGGLLFPILSKNRRRGITVASTPYIVVYSATWCGPCNRMRRDVWPREDVKAALAANGVKLYFADFDSKDPQIIKGKLKYGINSIPTMLFMDGSHRLVSRAEGYMLPRNLINWINESSLKVKR